MSASAHSAADPLTLRDRPSTWARRTLSPCLVAGMPAGADSIDDLGVLRHGAMPEVFSGIRAPSTLGSFLRSFTWGNVRQLDAMAGRLLAELASQVPLLPGADVLAFIDMDSMQKAHLRARQAGRRVRAHQDPGQDRVLRSCICGSDLWPYGSMPASEQGLRMGHEFLGVVEDTGAEVSGLRAGDATAACGTR